VYLESPAQRYLPRLAHSLAGNANFKVTICTSSGACCNHSILLQPEPHRLGFDHCVVDIVPAVSYCLLCMPLSPRSVLPKLYTNGDTPRPLRVGMHAMTQRYSRCSIGHLRRYTPLVSKMIFKQAICLNNLDPAAIRDRLLLHTSASKCSCHPCIPKSLLVRPGPCV
jgi:hypothetical protein